MDWIRVGCEMAGIAPEECDLRGKGFLVVNLENGNIL